MSNKLTLPKGFSIINWIYNNADWLNCWLHDVRMAFDETQLQTFKYYIPTIVPIFEPIRYMEATIIKAAVFSVPTTNTNSEGKPLRTMAGFLYTENRLPTPDDKVGFAASRWFCIEPFDKKRTILITKCRLVIK